jgi:3-oxoacyl-[acyl-carrier protein] reductase
MSNWRDQVVLITGAGSGIGKALSLALAKRGARVTVTDVDGASAERVAAQCGTGARAA